MKVHLSRILGSILLNLIVLGSSYGQEGSVRSGVSPRASEPPTHASGAAQILGIWGSNDESVPNQTYEFKEDGTCEAKICFSVVRPYVHDGNSVKIGPETSGQPKFVWGAQVDGNRLILKFSDDLPPCPYHRIDGEGSAADALVGTWAADKCGVEDWTPTSLKLKSLTSNAVYTFTENLFLYIHSRLEDVKPYSLKENTVLCPVFGMKGHTLRLNSQDGMDVLVPDGVSKVLVRVTPGDIAFHQYIPGDPSKENLEFANEAYADFKSKLESNPNDAATVEKIGSLLFLMSGAPFDAAKFQESKKYYKRYITLRPDDPYPYYMIGVIDWMLAFRANGEMRRDYNKEHLRSQVKDSEALPFTVRNEYASRYALIVNEGIDNLEKALTLRPDDDNALGYLNLIYRRRADLAESEAERTGFQKQADGLLDKVKAIQLANAAAGKVRQWKYPAIAVPPPPPPPPPPPLVTTGNRIVVNGAVAAADIISRVAPAYPPLARQTRIQGTVKLHAIIGTDGTVQEVSVIEGHPLLLQAAMNAVKQWRYQPTKVNGQPVEVDTQIDVIFALDQ